MKKSLKFLAVFLSLIVTASGLTPAGAVRFGEKHSNSGEKQFEKNYQSESEERDAKTPTSSSGNESDDENSEEENSAVIPRKRPREDTSHDKDFQKLMIPAKRRKAETDESKEKSNPEAPMNPRQDTSDDKYEGKEVVSPTKRYNTETPTTKSGESSAKTPITPREDKDSNREIKSETPQFLREFSSRGAPMPPGDSVEELIFEFEQPSSGECSKTCFPESQSGNISGLPLGDSFTTERPLGIIEQLAQEYLERQSVPSPENTAEELQFGQKSQQFESPSLGQPTPQSALYPPEVGEHPKTPIQESKSGQPESPCSKKPTAWFVVPYVPQPSPQPSAEKPPRLETPFSGQPIPQSALYPPEVVEHPETPTQEPESPCPESPRMWLIPYVPQHPPQPSAEKSQQFESHSSGQPTPHETTEECKCKHYEWVELAIKKSIQEGITFNTEASFIIYTEEIKKSRAQNQEFLENYKETLLHDLSEIIQPKTDSKDMINAWALYMQLVNFKAMLDLNPMNHNDLIYLLSVAGFVEGPSLSFNVDKVIIRYEPCKLTTSCYFNNVKVYESTLGARC